MRTQRHEGGRAAGRGYFCGRTRLGGGGEAGSSSDVSLTANASAIIPPCKALAQAVT
jgi:hypothetical protein